MDPDLEDSDVDVVQPVQRQQRRRGRLRKSLGSPGAAANLAGTGSDGAAAVSDASDDSDEFGPSRAAGRRRRSSRAAAADASRRLSLVAQPVGSSDSQEGPEDPSAEVTNGDEGASDSPSADEEPSGQPARQTAAGRRDGRNGGGSRQAAETPGRQSRRRRGSNAAANRAAAAGEAFRQRLAARKPAPDDAAVAEARRQSIQANGTVSDSDYESPPERSPPIQDFIVDEYEDEDGADDDDGAAGPHFRFEDEDGLDGMDEPARPPKKKRKKRKAKDERQQDAAQRLGRQRRQQGLDAAGPSDVAPPEASDGDANAAHAAPRQVIVLSSDDDDDQLSAPRSSRQQQRRRRDRGAADQEDSDDEGAARPSGVAGPSVAQLEDKAGSDDAAARETAAALAANAQRQTPRRRRRLSKVDDSDEDRMPPRRLGGGPFERQRTLHDFLSPQEQAANELEDEDAPTPRAPSEEAGSSMDDFIEEDDEESGEESSDDGDPVPAALEQLRRSLGDNDRDVTLARAFAEMACGLLHHFMGADMDRQLHRIYKEGLWRIMSTLETNSHEVGGQLGWVNAERNGVVAAIHRFTHFTTGHAYYGSGVTADNDTEDARDGRFTCEVCGRSTGGLASLTMSRPCRADAERLHLHSRSPGKKRPLRRRPPSDDEGEGGGSSRRRRRRQEDIDIGGDSDADERKVFWVGSDCVQRVMLRTLLQHWTCLFADKLQRVSRRAIERAAQAEDKKPIIAEEMGVRNRFFGFWCRHLRQTLGVAKKLETKARRAGFSHEPMPNSRFQSAGAEAIHLRNEFDQ